MGRLLRSLAAAAIVGQILVTSASAAGASPLKGLWTSTDTDGSRQVLIVSGGSTPSVTFEDFYASACATFGGPSTHWVSAGEGTVDGNVLWVSFHRSGCGSFSIGAYDDYWTYDAGSDTLIDSSAIVWSRFR